MTAYPIKDSVAIVGIGSTGFTRGEGDRSVLALALRACVDAVADAGLRAADIDGLCGTGPAPPVLASALGLQAVTYHSVAPPPFGFSVMDAMHALHSGACTHALVYHTSFRSPAVSRAAAADPLRRNLGFNGGPATAEPDPAPEDLSGALGYAIWASRYQSECGGDRRAFALTALNNRSAARSNPLAAIADPLTMADYQTARLVNEPFGLLDLDVAVDGADAVVLTTAARAADMPSPPILIHAATAGLTSPTEEAQIAGLHAHGQHVVAEALRRRSDIAPTAVDLFYPYDGSTFLAVSWTENLGWCGPREAASYLDKHWDGTTQRLLLEGRVPVNTHGGGLSEGATQGSGHLREAAHQLRGDAGMRQVPGDPQTALVALGGFFGNAQGFVLRRGER